MALYTSFLSIGVSIGVIISGLVTINHSWRVIYQVAAPMVGFVLLLAFFSFPETAYIREQQPAGTAAACPRIISSQQSEAGSEDVERAKRDKSGPTTSDVKQASPAPIPKRKTYLQSLKVFNGVLTSESLLRLAARPLGLICLPPVLWAALVQAVTIGFLVALTSNIDLAYQTTYHFQSWQVGLCFVSAIVGSIIGIPAGGLLGDKVADWFTRRNGGVRDPEMRLPATIPSLITTPLALVLYGVGIQHKLHWICPTIALGLRKLLGPVVYPG